MRVELWVRPQLLPKSRVDHLLPLYYTPTSPLPPCFTQHRDYLSLLSSKLTSAPYDVAFSLPITLQPDSPTRTFFGHQSVFSSLPFFAALFANPSETVARRSSYEGRTDFPELVELEAKAGLAEEKEEEGKADEEGPHSADEDEEDEEMTPAPESEGEGEAGEEEDPPTGRPRNRSPSPSPVKPLCPSIPHFTLPDFPVASFEPFYAYLYERAAAGKALTDFG